MRFHSSCWMVGELLAHVETHCEMASEGDVETTTVDLPILEEKKGFCG